LRVFQTQVSDAQGGLVLEVVNGDHGTVDAGRGTEGVSQGSVVPAAAASSVSSSSSLLPLAAVEQVLGSLEHASQVVQDSAFIQPGVILTSESSDQSPNTVRDLAVLQGPGGADQAEWLPQDWLTLQGQTARQSLAVSTLGDTQDSLTGKVDDIDLAGLEAYFAREAAGDSSARTS
jgi:hypothetical protein